MHEHIYTRKIHIPFFKKMLSKTAQNSYSGITKNIFRTHLRNFIQQFVVFLPLLKTAEIATHSNRK